MNKKNPFKANGKPSFDDEKNLSANISPLANGMTSEDKKNVAKYAIEKEYGLQNNKLIVGIMLFIIGFVCFLLGIFDVINFNFESQYFNAKVINASPGAFFAIIGLIIILSSNGKIK